MLKRELKGREKIERKKKKQKSKTKIAG